jgi:hypothetical protein
MPGEKRPLGRPKHRWEDNVKWISERQDEVVWSEMIWLRIGTSGELLQTQ